MPQPSLHEQQENLLMSLLHDYTQESGSYDEMWTPDGQAQPHWKTFIEALHAMGADELKHRYHEIRRLLRENGATYNMHGEQSEIHRPWELDIIPLILPHDEWEAIEKGLMQRATLFDLILRDIYGSRKIMHDGIVPLELIYSHQGFLRQCDDISFPGSHQLIVYSADLARGPDRRMWVLSDRAQAPSGAGYALENRTVMAQTLPNLFKRCRVRRLANFFRSLRSSLEQIAPERHQPPREVFLTPGPYNPSYFEHAYLAAYLGYSLVQGEDLTVRDGAVWLKSLGGLQPVDVILRRVNDSYCDPLELREDSLLGIAGLLEAARRQQVAIANPLGSGILENPGLLAFLPKLARYFLNEDLLLPSAATWWCGQSREREYVLEHLPELVLKRLFRQGTAPRTVVGSLLSAEELGQWRAEIRKDPGLFVGQEQVSFSTTPSLVNGYLEPRHAILRCFLAAQENGYAVMPGGLTRAAPEKGAFVVSNRVGVISKDTWVLSPTVEKHASLWLETTHHENAFESTHYLPSRAAENLFWVGRYAERAEETARLLRTVIDFSGSGELLEDDAECYTYLLQALTHITMTYPGFVGEEGQEKLQSPQEELLAVTLDSERSGSLASNVDAMTRCAYAVRNLWSTDTWRVIEDIDEPWRKLQTYKAPNLYQVQNELDRLMTRLMAFSGLSMESMAQEAGWLLLEIGRRLERALLTISLIRATLVAVHEEAVERSLLEAVLKTTENVITYRRRYRSYLQLETVLELLLLDEHNPRSLMYQMDKLQVHLAQLPQEKVAFRLSQKERLILEASTALRLSDIAALVSPLEDSALRDNLETLLEQLSLLLSDISQVVTQSYFSHTQVIHQLVSMTTGAPRSIV